MRKTLGSIDGKMQGALDWLRDPTAMQVGTIRIILGFRVNLKFTIYDENMQGGVGERSLRAIIEQVGLTHHFWLDEERTQLVYSLGREGGRAVLAVGRGALAQAGQRCLRHD